MKAQECKGVPNMNKPPSALTLRGMRKSKMETEQESFLASTFQHLDSKWFYQHYFPSCLTNRDAVVRVPVFRARKLCSQCALAKARDCREGWVMLMSGTCVVISEPQAGRHEAAKQLVIWCGLRYHSPGVKLCEWETGRGTSETTWTNHLCAESNGRLVSHSGGWYEVN